MHHPLERICILGLGYIGLPTASFLATKGYQVLGCDINPEIVNTINRGEIHIVEQDLDVLVRSAVNSGKLSASLTPQPADIYIIAVPTPFKDNRAPDLTYVEAATRAIAEFIEPGALIILESTCPVGTTEKIADWLATLRPDLDVARRENHNHDTANRVFIAHCPERVLPGHILRELIENDRIIGGIDKASAEKARDFYQNFVQGQLILTDSRTAEMTKLTENAFRDVNIAFANELSIISDTLDINVWELIRLANHHPRVNILQPGPGVGGHCIAVDPWFIVDSAPNHSHLIRTARQVNDSKPALIIERLQAQAAKFKSPIIACLGLAFKANVDDLRESPALHIVSTLASLNIGKLLIVEPHIDVLPHSLAKREPELELTDWESAIAKADIVLLLVDHKQFTDINSKLLDKKVVIDTRGLWQLQEALTY